MRASSSCRALLIISTVLAGCQPVARTSLLNAAYLDGAPGLNKSDASVQQKADALHAFLVGEIALDKGDTSEGLAALKKASGLVESPIPEISRQVAELHLQQREVDDAIVAYEELYRLDPKDASVVIPLAGLYEVRQDFDKARQLYEQVSPHDPRELEAMLLSAVVAGKTMGMGARTKVLERAAKRYPKEVLSHLLLGLSYEEQGDLKSAERSLIKAVRNDEKRVATLVELMRIQVQELELEDAVKTAHEIVRREPENLLARRVIASLDSGALQLEAKSFRLPPRHLSDAIGARLLIALTAIDKDRFKTAAEHLSLLVIADPADTQVRVFLATVFSALGKRAEALRELDVIPPTAKNYTKSRMLAAYIHKASGDTASALSAARQALAVSPQDITAKAFAIEILKNQGDYGEAITLVKETLAQRPRDPKLLFLLATLYHDFGDKDEAIHTIDKVLAIDPENENSLNYAAYTLAEDGRDLVRARSYIEKALRVEPLNGYFLDTLGWIQFQAGEHEAALETFLKARQSVPMDAVILLHTVRSYEKLGKLQEAASLMTRTLELFDEMVFPDEEQATALRELKAMHRSLKRSHPEFFLPKYPVVAQ